jgi:hypothetical protein
MNIYITSDKTCIQLLEEYNNNEKALDQLRRNDPSWTNSYKVNNKIYRCHPSFLALPDEVKEKNIQFFERVNAIHLHCELEKNWEQSLFYITHKYGEWFVKKLKKFALHSYSSSNSLTSAVDAAKISTPAPPLDAANSPATPVDAANPATTPANIAKPVITLADAAKITTPVHQVDATNSPLKTKVEIRKLRKLMTFEILLLTRQLIRCLSELYSNSLIATQVSNIAQKEIVEAYKNDAALVNLLLHWIRLNAMYLPLGEHLLKQYKKDMKKNSPFHNHVLIWENAIPLEEALRKDTVLSMEKFLKKAASILHEDLEKVKREVTQEKSNQPRVLMLSLKNGAGGHIAPHDAMAQYLAIQLGYNVKTIRYDTDISGNDLIKQLGITFENNEPMDTHLYKTRWHMQKQKKEESRILKWYIESRQTKSHAFDWGQDLLKQAVSFNPHLIITTCAYHWCWKSLAFRLASAKTILVASDVFFHREALMVWYRQQTLDVRLRRVFFTTMTNDLELLKSFSTHHDNYFQKKSPSGKITSLKPLTDGFTIDEQVTVIGAPTRDSFSAVTDVNELKEIRLKWGVENGAFVVVISRGQLGYTEDFIPALKAYETDEKLARPVELHVVCGENDVFYNQLQNVKNPGPNIKIVPHKKLSPPDFAALRAIAELDDIKAGGASTFEGWKLISSGALSNMVLVAGEELFWERSNIDAMVKWNVGFEAKNGESKIPILKNLMKNRPQPILNRYPDWKAPFKNVVENLMTGK